MSLEAAAAQARQALAELDDLSEQHADRLAALVLTADPGSQAATLARWCLALLATRITLERLVNVAARPAPCCRQELAAALGLASTAPGLVMTYLDRLERCAPRVTFEVVA